MTSPDVYVCEHSHNQGFFHIHRLSDALQKNKFAIVHGYPVDYIPFALADSMEEANRICNAMRHQIREREDSNDPD